MEQPGLLDSDVPGTAAMPLRRIQELVLLAAATALSRFAFRSHRLYDIDSVNFALALHRFDPRVHQPHPPGYFLYILAGRVLRWIWKDDNAALIAMSIAASCGAAVMIYLLTLGWFGDGAARFSGIVFLLSPLAWFHGTVALTYIVEAFFSALVGFFCWRAFKGSKWSGVLAAATLGVATGFRPSSILLLAPLVLFALRHSRAKVFALGSFLAACMAWIIPMLGRTGGFESFWRPLWMLWSVSPSRETVFNSSPLTSVARWCTLVAIYGLCFGAAALLPLVRPRREVDPQLRAFLAVWIGPGLLFFGFIFLRFVNSGYLLALMPPACAWLGALAAGWFARSRTYVFATGAAANVAIFLFAPVYCSWGEVRRFEAQLGRIVAALPKVAPPATAVIVGFDAHFLGYRHAGYYLPDYTVVEFPAVATERGTEVLRMRARGTNAVANLSEDSPRVFIVFPLPSSQKEYEAYAAGITRRFPRDHLRTVVEQGIPFTVGPAADLPFLFSSFARSQSP